MRKLSKGVESNWLPGDFAALATPISRQCEHFSLCRGAASCWCFWAYLLRCVIQPGDDRIIEYGMPAEALLCLDEAPAILIVPFPHLGAEHSQAIATCAEWGCFPCGLWCPSLPLAWRNFCRNRLKTGAVLCCFCSVQLFCSILFCSVLFYSILFYCVIVYHVLPCDCILIVHDCEYLVRPHKIKTVY